MDLEGSTDPETEATRSAGTSMIPPVDPRDDDGPTVTIPRRDRSEVECGLLFGLVAMANGLLGAEALTRALAAWALDEARPLRAVILERGDLDGPAASTVAGLVEAHLSRHHGIAWQALIALGDAVRFRVDPRRVADPELRAILSGFADRPDRAANRAEGIDGLGSRYEIIRPHARGGLGVVSLARDLEIRREVAVKEIRDDCADNTDYRARFLREAEVTGRLEHPGIVPVYGMGFHDDGRPYYIMRFIRGETLKAAIHRLHKPRADGEGTAIAGDGLDLHALVGRFVDACHALAYAHHRKILHRDIKPINIMLGPFGETLVVDWGLAKSFGGPLGGDSPITTEDGTLRPESGSELTPTRVGSQVGTTGYMSPEQEAGRLAELGPASDIYSLGVTLHYLSTGHAPFEGAGREEFARRVREGDFPHPRQVNPAVPRALEAICLKCMALRPIDRYRSVGDLIEDLERWRAGSPVLAYPEPPMDRLARWSKRHRTALAGAAVLLVCTTVGMAVLAERKDEEARIVGAERIRANRARAASETNLKSALNSLKSTLEIVQGADLTFLARSETLRDRMAGDLVRSYRDLSRAEPTDPRVRRDLAGACELSATIGRSMGKHDPSRLLYAEAIGIVESLEGEISRSDNDVIKLAELHHDSGENERMAGRPGRAEAEYVEGLKILRQPSRLASREAARRRVESKLRIGLAWARRELGRLDEAMREGGLALDLIGTEASGRTDRLMILYALLGRGTGARLAKEFAAAATTLAEANRRARELLAKVPDPDTKFALAIVRNEQGLLLLDNPRAGSTGEALEAFREAESILAGLSEDLPKVIVFRRNLAGSLSGRAACLLARGRPGEAREPAEKARAMLLRLDEEIPGHFGQLGELGWVHAILGRISRAESRPDARDLLLRAIAYHSAALAANPSSPSDEEPMNRCRAELIAIPGKAEGALPGK